MDGSGPVVLVVEDEALVQLVAVDQFEDHGFRALASADAEEALRVLETAAEKVDVLFTDVNLGPGADGFELARRARALRPDLAVVYVSGAPQADVRARRVPGGVFLSKPYDFAQVMQAVRRAAG